MGLNGVIHPFHGSDKLRRARPRGLLTDWFPQNGPPRDPGTWTGRSQAEIFVGYWLGAPEMTNA